MCTVLLNESMVCPHLRYCALRLLPVLKKQKKTQPTQKIFQEEHNEQPLLCKGYLNRLTVFSLQNKKNVHRYYWYGCLGSDCFYSTANVLEQREAELDTKEVDFHPLGAKLWRLQRSHICFRKPPSYQFLETVDREGHDRSVCCSLAHHLSEVQTQEVRQVKVQRHFHQINKRSPCYPQEK